MIFRYLRKKRFLIKRTVKLRRYLQNKKIELLQQFGIFSHFAYRTLKKLSFYLFERKPVLHQIIYKENESPDGVYLIDEGEFEIYK